MKVMISRPTLGLPSWVSSLPLMQWHRLPTPLRFKFDGFNGAGVIPWASGPGFAEPYNVDFDSRPGDIQGGAGESEYIVESGMGVRHNGSWLMIHGGGHRVTEGNGVIICKLNAENPHWEVGTVCSDKIDAMLGHVADYNAGKRWRFCKDGRPVSGHSNYKMWFNQQTDRWVNINSGDSSNVNWGSGFETACWDFQSRDWVQPNKPNANDPSAWTTKFPPNVPGNGYNDIPRAFDYATGDMYICRAPSANGFAKLSTSGPAGSWTLTTLSSPTTFNMFDTWHANAMCFVPEFGGRVMMLRYSGVLPGELFIKIVWYDKTSGAWVDSLGLKPVPAESLPTHPFGNPQLSTVKTGMFWEPNLGKLLVMWPDAKMIQVDPNTGQVEPFVPMVIGGVKPNHTFVQGGVPGVTTKIQYVPELRGFAYVSSSLHMAMPASQAIDWPGTIWFVRTAL